MSEAPPFWVVDTNVVVSGLLNAAGLPVQLIDFARIGHFVIAYNDAIRAEYFEVLAGWL